MFISIIVDTSFQVTGALDRDLCVVVEASFIELNFRRHGMEFGHPGSFPLHEVPVFCPLHQFLLRKQCCV